MCELKLLLQNISANLTDLDLGLLYEGTMASFEYIKPELGSDCVGFRLWAAGVTPDVSVKLCQR